MNMKNIFCCLLPGLLFGACANKVYEETGDSVIVKVQQEVTGGPRLVRLQVMGDKLIRVSATSLQAASYLALSSSDIQSS